jgi:protein arginine N-methyltransferase 5
MESQSRNEAWSQPFYVAHHTSERSLPVTAEDIDRANECNVCPNQLCLLDERDTNLVIQYDMLTTPITNAHFHSRILKLISDHDGEQPIPRIPALSPLDTPLSPGDIIPQLLAFTNRHIDICSPDPLISGLSKQVLSLEVAYAAFCGLEYVFVAGPKLYHDDGATQGVLAYARAIQDALSTGSHLQVIIVMPMVDQEVSSDTAEVNDLASMARHPFRADFDKLPSKHSDAFGTWDAWNLIRSTCKYNTRLSMGMLRCPYRPISPSRILIKANTWQSCMESGSYLSGIAMSC